MALHSFNRGILPLDSLRFAAYHSLLSSPKVRFHRFFLQPVLLQSAFRKAQLLSHSVKLPCRTIRRRFERSIKLCSPRLRSCTTVRCNLKRRFQLLPGLFRGTFDARATVISEEMKIAAARAIAETIPDDLLNEDYILPSVFNLEVTRRVAEAVAAEAARSGKPRPPVKPVSILN